MALDFYYDHSLEALAELYVENVYGRGLEISSAADLLQAHIVVVQTRGMAEFLRQYLAEKCHIAANLDMPFLNGFVNSTLSTLYGSDFKEAALRSDPEHMRLLIMQILSEQKFVQEELAALAGYISGENSELKRWQIAGAIAGVFDHYQLYRSNDKISEMFAKASPANSWQKVLYERLFNSSTPGRDKFFQRFAETALDEVQSRKLPRSVTVFGVGAMPPEYFEFFVNLARYCQVNFFYLTPCLEYWENQKSTKEIKKPAPWEVAAAGNPLLQNLGRQGRSFFSCIMNCEAVSSQMEPGFAGGPDDYPPGSTMLDIMQYDIRYLFDRRSCQAGENSDFIGKERFDLKSDRSISIHNCHSVRRELEVLHDELLKLIRQGTDPSSIIVMAPDIAACAPVIHAVFGNGALANVYNIADMPPPEYAMALTAFKSILNTADSRFEYSNVITLLDQPLISSALGFDNGELTGYGELIYQAGARWGFNDQMHKKFCGTAFDEFSWQQAIDRLLAGFANRTVNGSESVIAGGSKVMDALESSDIEGFARLVRMLEKLEELSGKITGKKDIPVWCGIFENIMEDFLGSGNSERTALAPLRSAARKLRNAAFKGFIPGEYPLNAALQMLEDHVSNSIENGRFLRGKITFCRMMPMRSIPMDTVAILELNEGAFPRNKAALGFDLISLLPNPGDRSLTAQDRYLLLEALMAARKNLLLFYQGQDPRNGEELPPCAPLSEIMDYLSNAFGLQAYKHKVSGISEVYFTADAPYRSLNMENFMALKNLQQLLQFDDSAAEETSEQVSLSDLYVPWKIRGNIAIEDLVRFFENPCRWFLKQRFNLFCDNSYGFVPEDDELWSLSALDRYNVNALLMDMRKNHLPDSEIYLHARKSNMLPPGRTGQKEFADIACGTADLPEFWKKALMDMERLPAVYKSESKDYTISGMVNVTADRKYVLICNWSSYKSKHALNALLQTLTFAAGAAAENRSITVGAKLLNLDSKNGFEFRKIEPVATADAIKLLEELVDLAGEEHKGPLPLFEKSSVCYRDPNLAQNKFMKSDHCDVARESVSYFFDSSMWFDKSFNNEFNWYAAKLYALIIADEDDENAGK